MTAPERRWRVIAASAASGCILLACLVSAPDVARGTTLVTISLVGLTLFALATAFATGLVRHWRLVRRLSRHSRPASIAGHRVRLIDGSGGPFVAGLLRPAIYLPADGPARLTRDELHAVLAHESAHQRDLAPARMLLLTTLDSVLGRLPWVRNEVTAALAMLEIRADQHALASGARRSTLASALLLMAGDEPAMAAAFGREAELRVRVLLGEEAMPPTTGLRWLPLVIPWTMACLASSLL